MLVEREIVSAHDTVYIKIGILYLVQQTFSEHLPCAKYQDSTYNSISR